MPRHTKTRNDGADDVINDVERGVQQTIDDKHRHRESSPPPSGRKKRSPTSKSPPPSLARPQARQSRRHADNDVIIRPPAVPARRQTSGYTGGANSNSNSNSKSAPPPSPPGSSSPSKQQRQTSSDTFERDLEEGHTSAESLPATSIANAESLTKDHATITESQQHLGPKELLQNRWVQTFLLAFATVLLGLVAYAVAIDLFNS